MPKQDTYPAISVADANTFATGFRKDPVTGVLTTIKIPADFLYGSQWTVGVGVPTVAGVGEGDQYLNVSNGDLYSWDIANMTWGDPVGTLINGAYQFPIWIAGKPLNSEILYSFEAPTPFVFEQGMTDSVASATSGATADAVVSLQKNGVEFATITYAAGSSVGVYACAAIVAFDTADVFDVIAPAVSDATLANMRMTIVAIRPSGAALSDIVNTGDAAASAAAAAASATAAAASAVDADTSSGTASLSATNAATSEANAGAFALTAGNAVAPTQAAAAAALVSEDNAATSAAAAAVSATQAAASASAISQIAGANRIINGDCRIGQLPAVTVTATGNSTFGGVDRFGAVNNASGSFTQSQGSITYNGTVYPCVKQTVVTPSTTIAGSKWWVGIQQLIEGFNCFDLIGQPVVVSFVFESNVTGLFSFSFGDNSGSNSYSSTINATANVPLLVSFLIPTLPATMTTTNTTDAGMYVEIGGLTTGSNQAITLNAWTTQSVISSPGVVNWSATAGNYIAVTNLQLVPGTAVTQFQRLPYETAFALCRRYLRTGKTHGYAYAAASAAASQWVEVEPMRTTPTVTLTNVSANNCNPVGTVGDQSTTGFTIHHTATALGAVDFSDSWVATCEMT